MAFCCIITNRIIIIFFKHQRSDIALSLTRKTALKKKKKNFSPIYCPCELHRLMVGLERGDWLFCEVLLHQCFFRSAHPKASDRYL